jgi:sialidase-1
MKTVVTVASSEPPWIRRSEGDSIELRDGRQLLVYMEFSGDGSDWAPTRLSAKESADGGLTWERHRLVTTTAPGDVNVYCPNLIRTLDGEILLIFMRQHTAEPRTLTLHSWKSSDEGESFTEYCEFMAHSDLVLCNAVVRRLDTGRLVLPVNPQVDAPPGPWGLTYAAAVVYSDDDGLTWQEAANRVHLPLRGAMEPHVEQTRDGRVLMVMRNQLGALFISESADDGITWSLPQTTGLRSPESCPLLARIPDTGDLLMIWNNSPYDPGFASHFGKRSPLTAAVSRDEGRTWGYIRDIENDPSRAFSNPGVRFTSDGKALLNYWTCEYLPDWRMQDIIDCRVAVVDTEWFYEGDDTPIPFDSR